jgi:glycosyltransferase involved in cell wall biosynthesis
LKYSSGHDIDPESRLHFLLWRTDIPAILTAMDILLHTSLNEGTPVSILESMAMGKPVVATPVGGIPELLDASGAGMVSDNESELIDLLVQLAANPVLRQTMGEKGKHYIDLEMSLSKQAGKLDECIRAKSN